MAQEGHIVQHSPLRHVAGLVLRPLDRIDNGLARVEAGAGFAILVALIGVLSLQVASRQLPFFYITWTEEVSRFLFAWLAFLGTALAFQRNAHIAIGFAVDRAPAAMQAGAAILVRLLILGFAVIMVVYGLRLCLSTRMVSTVLRIPMWLPYASIPVAGALMVVHGVIGILRILVQGQTPQEVRT
jgi:TRAP-type C4-dicarboxylate transport system permease small subunit